MSDFLDWSTLIYRAPALLIAMALHEYAHAYVSDSLGDPTPSMQGRLTANPLVHLDMVGLMLLVICGFGWAKPVEINPNYYKNFRSGVMKVSFAGDESAYLFSGGVHYAADDEARASNGGAAGAFVSLLDYAVQCVVRVF